jgi:hypothetical protein
MWRIGGANGVKAAGRKLASSGWQLGRRGGESQSRRRIIGG